MIFVPVETFLRSFARLSLFFLSTFSVPIADMLFLMTMAMIFLLLPWRIRLLFLYRMFALRA